MKEEKVKFVCDSCGKEIQVNKGVGFPYRKGWSYLHNFQAKFGKYNKLETGDKHFCSPSCMCVYINKKVNEE